MKKTILTLFVLVLINAVFAQPTALKVGEDNYFTVKAKLIPTGITINLAGDELNVWTLTGGDFLIDIPFQYNGKFYELFFANNILYAIKEDEVLIKTSKPFMKRFKKNWQ